MAELSEQDKYRRKLADLQKYVPFLENMIKHLKNTKEGSREVQLTKMESLYSMITDKNRKLKYDILLKCEEVIVKLQGRMCSNFVLSPVNEIESKEAATKKPVNTSKKDQQEQLNTKNSETPSTSKKYIDSTSKPKGSKELESKTVKEIEPQIKEEEEEEEDCSGSEKMDEFQRNRRDAFYDRRHVRNNVTYGRKYRPFSTASVSKQNIILPILLDVMKPSFSHESSDMPLQQLECRGRDDSNYRTYSSPLGDPGGNYRDNYNNYHGNMMAGSSNRYTSSSPLNDPGENCRDNYNNYYDDNMRMASSNRYLPDILEAERNDYDRINDRSQVWHGNTEPHDEQYQNYEQDNSFENRKSSPTIDGFRRFNRNFDRGVRYDRDESRCKRNHYQPGRRSFRDPRFSSYRNENNSRNAFYRRDNNDNSDNEYTERFDSTRPDIINRDETLNNYDLQQEMNVENDTVTRHEHFVKNDPRGYSKNYKNLSDNIPKVQDYTDKSVGIVQNNIENTSVIQAVKVWESNLVPSPELVTFKTEDRIRNSSEDHWLNSIEKTRTIDENKTNLQDVSKQKEIEKTNLRIDEKHVRNAANVRDISKTQVDVEQHDKDKDKFLKTIEDTPTSKYDKMYTNLANKNLFVSPLEALYSDNSRPKNFKIPKKPNPSKKLERSEKETSTDDDNKTIENETNVSIQEIPKANSKKNISDKSMVVDKINEINHVNLSKKSRIRKKIVTMDNDSDEENIKESVKTSVKQPDQNIKSGKEKTKHNKSSKDTCKSIEFEDESEIGTVPTKRRKLNLREDDKPIKLMIEDEQLSVEKSKEVDNACTPNDDDKIESIQNNDDESTQKLSNTGLICNQDTVMESAKFSCSVKHDNANDESTANMNEPCTSQGGKEAPSSNDIQQTKEEVVQEASKKSNSQETNSIDLLEFIMKNFKQIKKIFKKDSSSDEEDHSAKKAKKKKKKKKRKKYSSSSSSSSESDEEKKRKTKRESSNAVGKEKCEESASAQKDDNKVEVAICNDKTTKEVSKGDTNLEQKKTKRKSDVLEEKVTDATNPANIFSAKEDFKKKTNSEPKHRKSELDILHESIKEMWMGDDIVRSTGKRSCTVSKEPIDSRSVKVKKIEPIEKFIENASKLRVIVIREDFTKLLKKNISKEETLHDVSVTESREKLKAMRKSSTVEKEKLEGDNHAKSYYETPTTSNTSTPITNAVKPVAVSTADIASTSARNFKFPFSASAKVTPQPKQESPKLLVSTSTAVTLQSKDDSLKLSVSASTSVTPLIEQDTTKSAKRQPIKKVQLLRSHHDKSYFIHQERTNCRLCSFNGKLITAHYITRHKTYEVLTSRINPVITDRLISGSKVNHYESMTLNERPKSKFPYMCPFCETAFASDFVSNFYDHLTSHTGEHRHQCDQCDYTSHNVRLFQKHYTRHNGQNILSPREPPPHSAIVFGYVCVECYFVQLLKESIDRHVQSYHENKAEIIKVNLNVFTAESRKVDDTVIDGAYNANDEHEPDFNVNSLLQVKLENASNVNAVNSEQEDCEDYATVKVEANEIQGAGDGQPDNSDENSDERDCDTPNLGAFVCGTNIVDQKVEKRRLDKMNEILENVNIPRASVADKLQSKLVSNEAEFVEIPYQLANKSKDKRILQPSGVAFENNHNVQAQKAKPSRTFMAETKQGVNAKVIVSDKSLVEPKISGKTRTTESNTMSILKPVKLNVSSNPVNPELSRTLISQPAAANKKFTPISNIINRLQDNLQPNLQKKPGKSVNDGNESSRDDSSEKHDTQSNQNDNSPPPLIHYKELVTDSKKRSLPAVQMPTKTYRRSPRKSGSNNVTVSHSSQNSSSLCLDVQEKSDQDLPPPLSHYKNIIMNRSSGLLLKAGPIKIMTSKYGNMLYSCLNCVFLTEDRYDFESHCEIAHLNHIYEAWSCSKCDKVFSKRATPVDIFRHIKCAHLDFMDTNEMAEPIAQDDADSIKDSGIGSTSNIDTSSNSSLILQNNTADSKYRFIITSVKSLANDSKASSVTGSLHSGISIDSPSESVPDNNDTPPAPIKITNEVCKHSSTTKPEYIRPVPISKLLDNAEDELVISSTLKVQEPIIEPKTALATKYLLNPEKVAHFYKCPVFDCVFSCFGSVEFNQHLLLHPDVTVFCLYCNKAAQLTAYVTHLESTHFDCRYACSLCFYRATSPTLVKAHIAVIHNQAKKVMIVETPVTTLPQRMTQLNEYPTIRNLIKPYVCGETDCKMETIFGSIFLEHYFTVHYSKRKMTCGLCNDKLFKGILQHYWAVHDIYPYHCRYCPSGSHKLHLLVQHQALRHSDLPLCLLSRSPKKLKKDFPKTYHIDEYDNIQILFEKAIDLNKISINTTEMPPDNVMENNTLLLNTTAVTSSDTASLEVDNPTETSEIEMCTSNDLVASAEKQIQDEIDLPQNILDSNEEIEDVIDVGDDLCPLNFPNTTFSTSIEENLRTFIVPKTDRQETTTTDVIVPIGTPYKSIQSYSSSFKKRFTCVVCSVQFVHKSSAIEHMKKLHPISDSASKSTEDLEPFLHPKCNEKYIAQYYTYVDGTLYPACNICGLQVTRRRCNHVKARSDDFSFISGKMTTSCFVFPNLKTVQLRKMVVDALIIPSFKSNNRYWCCEPSCLKYYRTASSFSRHLRTMHSNDKYYSCGHCGVLIKTHSKLINLYAIHKHFELHGPTLYRCYQCHYFDTMIYTMELHMTVVHPSRSPTDYEVVRRGESKSQKNSKKSVKTLKKTKSGKSISSSNAKSNSLLRNSLLSTSTTTESSSEREIGEELDPLEIIVCDSEDDENSQNIVQREISDLFAIHDDGTTSSEFDIPLNDDNTNSLASMYTDLENDTCVTDVSDKLAKLVNAIINEDKEESNNEIDNETSSIQTSACRTYSKNKGNKSNKPNKSSTLVDTNSHVIKDSCDIETIVIDDVDEDCDTQNQANVRGSIEQNVQFQESECGNKHIEKKVFIKLKAFSSKSLIEEGTKEEIISPCNLNIQALSNKLQKAICHDEEENLSEEVPFIDGKISNKHSEVDEVDFMFGRPSGPFPKTSLNRYKCPVCSFETAYSKEFLKHLSFSCTDLRHLVSMKNSPVKKRTDWACSVLKCQTKIMNFWKDTNTSEECLCRFCPMMIATSTRRRHEEAHFTAKPFCCRYCNFSCVEENDVNIHITQRHKNISNPTYDTKMTRDFPICPSPNVISNDLFLMELLNGSDYEDLDEPINSYLRTAMSSLWNFMGNCAPLDESRREQQYACAKCKKSYSDLDLLKLHMKTHYKVYKCKYCEFAACNYRCLRKHHFDKHAADDFEFLYDFFVESNLEKVLKYL